MIAFRYYTPEMADEPVISVDGIAPLGLNLSHWPGHRTPHLFRADLATESCLRLAGHPDWEYWTAPFDTVTNTHVDTDGILSVFTVLQPRLALAYADLLTEAAASGDLDQFWSPDGLQLDYTLQCFTGDEERSPILHRLPVDGTTAHRRQRLYDGVLAELPRMLQDLAAYRPYWEEAYADTLEAVRWATSGAVEVHTVPALDLAFLTCSRELPMLAVRTLTMANRVCMCIPADGGHIYRLFYGIETWFDLVQCVHLPRIDLAPLAGCFQDAEPRSSGHWDAEPIDELTPSLRCVDNAGTRCASQLDPDWVRATVVAFFASAASHSAARN